MTSTAPIRLSIEGVTKSFGATQAIRGVSLNINAGEVHALIGENGAGKSTLMKVLSGALQPDSGTLFVDGETYSPRGPSDARRRGVAMIYQELNLAPHLTVEQNLSLGREQSQFGFVLRDAMRPQIYDVLRRLGIADLEPDTLVGSLSQGAKQLIEIARALLDGAKVLIMDEPTSSLSRSDSLRLFEITKALAREGCAVVYISHFMDELREVAESYTVLRDGATVGSGLMKDVTDNELVTLMAGRPVERASSHLAENRGEELLCVSDLSGERFPQGASLVLHRGEILGIVGLVGAGRTELLRTVFGLERIRAGTVRVGAHGFRSSDGVDSRWKLGIGMVSEDRKGEGLMLDLPISNNLVLSRVDSVAVNGWISRSALVEKTMKWIQSLDIRASSVDAPVGSLSGGNQQKVALARLLHHDVDVLLLDEPTRGIDVRSKATIWNLIRDLAASGKAILVVGSHLPEMLAGCDALMVMQRGRLGEKKAASAWTEHSLLVEATAGSGDIHA